MSDNPTIYKRTVPNEVLNYQKKAKLSDGTPVGKRGALWYVLDENNRAVSKGHHEIRTRSRYKVLERFLPKKYIGKIGAETEVFTV